MAVLLAALAMFESGNDDLARGKDGEVSRYQILKSVWHNHTPSRAYDSKEIGETVARAELTKRIDNFVRETHRLPDYREVYALWTKPSMLRNVRFNVDRMPQYIRKRCSRFKNLAQEIAQQRLP